MKAQRHTFEKMREGICGQPFELTQSKYLQERDIVTLEAYAKIK